ncbi:Gfo/Idh/MocA family protein [Azospirillum sp. B4]|uniref:Gfo/Idh/MocA family protein n=1 Tax=Azospirillum sp. B4 TaxID=95605 RepID=UPI00034DE4D3|nr:Gfo/Idh/MocA family oxidoreductase [Azospirillum sp. B4]
MSARLRFGIIGTGMMGVEHITSLALSPEVAVTAIVDPTPTSLDWARDALGERAAGVAAYRTVEEMVGEAKLDGVIIASPNHTHHDVLRPLLGTGLHILCEKPLCSSLEDAARVAEAAAGHKGVFWVGMEYRYMPPVGRFVEQVHGGRVGRLVMLSMREHRFPFLTKVGDWNRFSRNTGGTMVEKCCHFFDLMRLTVGAEAVRVYCSGAMDVNHRDERYGGQTPDIIDNSYTVVDFANGVRALLDLSMFAEGAQEQEEIVAVGDQARLDVTIPRGDLVHSPRQAFRRPELVERTHVAVDGAALAAGSHHGATYFQHRAFLDAILNGGPVAVSAEDGYRAVEIGAAAELSAREHRAVDLAELRR